MPDNAATFDDALGHWNAAKSLIGQQEASELFEKIFDLDKLDLKRNSEGAFPLLEWIYNNIDRKEEYKIRLVNMSFDLALEALTRQQISNFFRRLENAGRVDSDIRDIARKLRSLGDRLIRRVITETERHAVGARIKEVRRDMYGTILLRALMMFANSNLPSGFGPEDVTLVLDEVLMTVTEDLRSS